ncbi:MAG: polysaccharide biosynthesis PFTS motif protein [Denitromonas halophila]|nr:MAG: polysaccharide biosynthesis PFTS motif protein [Denitromonas halophila]
MFRLLSLIPGTAAWHRKRLRATMRGYRALKTSGRLGVIGEIKNALTEAPIRVCAGKFSAAVLGAVTGSAELALRQYLLIQLGGVNLNRALLMAAANPQKSIAYPMPRDWRQRVEQHGFRVSEWRCALYWGAYVFGMWAYGTVRTFRIMLDGVRSGSTRKCDGARYACFLDLSPANVPSRGGERPSHDVVSWYAQWPGRNPTISAIRHGVIGAPRMTLAGLEVSPQKASLPPLAGAREITTYLRWSLAAIVRSAFDALRGRWWHAVMLSHAAVAAQVRHVPGETLATTYLFNNSGWIYRPLWTYEAERKGCEIVMYFYSTNSEPFKRAEGYPSMYYGYRAMNWPRYLVWDEDQADFIRRATAGAAHGEVVGPIWFQGHADEVPCEPGFSVAVFDVTPTRSSWYRILGLDTEFYVPATVNAFLEHIWQAASHHQGRMLWKRKRNIGRTAHPRYRACAERLGNAENVMLVDPAVSAMKVIEAATVTISLPFTSTALLARHLGKPSAYYDPSGSVQSDDRAAHGIPVLSGPAELAAWLRVQRQGNGPAAS